MSAGNSKFQNLFTVPFPKQFSMLIISIDGQICKSLWGYERRKKTRESRRWLPVWESWQQCVASTRDTRRHSKRRKSFSPSFIAANNHAGHTLFSLLTRTATKSKRGTRSKKKKKKNLTKHIPFVGPFVMSCERCEGHQFFGVVLSSPHSSIR